VTTTDLAYPVFQPLIEGWNHSPHNASEGVWELAFIQGLRGVRTLQEIHLCRLQPGFRAGSATWAARPSYCSETRLQALLGVHRWDDAVDLGMAFQRGLRETEAWITMVEMQRKFPPVDIHYLRHLTLPVANNNRIGLWVNCMRN
jgi:hypothetical protein